MCAEYVNISQASRISGHSRREIYRRIESGDLPALPAKDNRRLIAREDVERVLGKAINGEKLTEHQRVMQRMDEIEAMISQSLPAKDDAENLRLVAKKVLELQQSLKDSNEKISQLEAKVKQLEESPRKKGFFK